LYIYITNQSSGHNAADITTTISAANQDLIKGLIISGDLNHRMIDIFPQTNQHGESVARLTADNGTSNQTICLVSYIHYTCQ
jgi:hypothetical protein